MLVWLGLLVFDLLAGRPSNPPVEPSGAAAALVETRLGGRQDGTTERNLPVGPPRGRASGWLDARRRLSPWPLVSAVRQLGTQSPIPSSNPRTPATPRPGFFASTLVTQRRVMLPPVLALHLPPLHRPLPRLVAGVDPLGDQALEPQPGALLRPAPCSPARLRRAGRPMASSRHRSGPLGTLLEWMLARDDL